MLSRRNSLSKLAPVAIPGGLSSRKSIVSNSCLTRRAAWIEEARGSYEPNACQDRVQLRVLLS